MSRWCVKYAAMLLLAGLCASLAGCMFTGVESTPKVTDKDVARAVQELPAERRQLTLTPFRDSVPAWQAGKKRFVVADDQARLMFVPSAEWNPDSLHLAGDTLTYVGYEAAPLMDNRNTLTLNFTHGQHHFQYKTNKTLGEFTGTYSIPFLIDLDLVAHVSASIAGRDLWVLTPIWYDLRTGDMIDGRHFIQVHIDSVLPGNKVLPLRVVFTAADSGQRAMLWMSDGNSSMHSRDFDSLFARRDPRQNYPQITDQNWALIQHGQVALEMTKEECRLALGSPKSIDRMPDSTGLREVWYYDGGTYLFFTDGILKSFRR